MQPPRWLGKLCPMAPSEWATRPCAHKGVSTAPCALSPAWPETRVLASEQSCRTVEAPSRVSGIFEDKRRSAYRSLGTFRSLSGGSVRARQPQEATRASTFELERVRTDQGLRRCQCPQSRRALPQGADTRTVTREFVAST